MTTRYKSAERYVFGWSDPRAMYGCRAKFKWPCISEALISQIMGTLLLMMPIIAICRWLGLL